ncbi:DNA repair protein RadC [Dyadobacter beijingensis]|uniref:DNA repair protein RadC n=1 Tax=Dyadobacter beijingensis TaxID=365489 RepID=A0ABQ2HHI6_9BACT|nr:DNA repair protein RadC [Dyadobacter beijingensis]GGM81462.1 DNA repair protein RadC [Dyadobacter beijingensis]
MPRKKSDNPKVIVNWHADDQPREKFMNKGRAACSDSELMAILIHSGTKEMSAVDLAKSIMASVGNNINELAKLNVKDLTKIKGIGEAKALTVLAALELGRRRSDIIPVKKPKITGSKPAYEAMRPYLMDKTHEEFWILLLNRGNYVMRAIQVGVGGIAGVPMDVKMIFKFALDHMASSLILVHNHPSGQLVPSLADKLITAQIKEAGQLLDLPILDHMIFTDEGYYSFKDAGEM